MDKMTDAEIVCGFMEAKPIESPGAWDERIHAAGGDCMWPDWWEQSSEFAGEWQPAALTLDALHEVEARLTEAQWRVYESQSVDWWSSGKIISGFRATAHATAEQKLAALARAISGQTVSQ